MTIGVLMLAAGTSRRFGGDKRRALLADGRSVLRASVDRALDSGLPLRVCLAPGDLALQEMLTGLGVEVMICAGARRGMGQTLAEGVADLPPWQGLLLALADMPFVASETYRAVAAALRPGAICRPQFQDRYGHPVGFDQQYFSSLRQLSGDTGARQLVRDHSHSVIAVAVADPGIGRDIDRPADLAS